MGRLKEVRAKLMTDLAVLDIPVMDDWSIRADPPCIFLAPPQGTDYLTAGDEFALCFVMNLDVVILVEARPPNEGREELEDLLEDVLRNTVDWAFEGADSPGIASKSDSTVEFLGTVVHLAKKLYL